MVTWNSDDLTRIAAIGPVKPFAVVIRLHWTIDHIAEMKQEGWIERASAGLKIRRHFFGYLLASWRVDAAVAEGVKADLSQFLDLAHPFWPDDLRVVDRAVIYWRRSGAELSLFPVTFAYRRLRSAPPPPMASNSVKGKSVSRAGISDGARRSWIGLLWHGSALLLVGPSEDAELQAFARAASRPALVARPPAATNFSTKTIACQLVFVATILSNGAKIG